MQLKGFCLTVFDGKSGVARPFLFLEAQGGSQLLLAWFEFSSKAIAFTVSSSIFFIDEGLQVY